MICIAAGEYSIRPWTISGILIQAQAVDVMQADAPDVAGIEFLGDADLCECSIIPLSAHTSPSIHATLCVRLPAMNVEYFFDHSDRADVL